MVLHRTDNPAQLLKLLGYATAYACALVTGTALLIGAIATPEAIGINEQTLTASELTTQQATDQALVADASQTPAIQLPQDLLVAAGTPSNDKRGY